MPAGYFAPTTGLLWRVIESSGNDAAAAFETAGVDAGAVRDPGARISCAAAESLWQQLESVTHDPCVGLRTAGFLHPSHLGALGYAWLASGDLRTALHRLVRYVHLLTDLRRMQLIEQTDRLRLITIFKVPAASVSVRADASLAMLVRMCRWNCGNGFKPIAIEVRRDPPPCADRYERFFECPVRFSAEHDAVDIASADADRQLPGDNPQIAQLNEELVIEYLANLHDSDLVMRVKARMIEQMPSGAVRVGKVASDLHMSQRTLQRRLMDLDTSFREVLEATRRDLAEQYLRDRRLSITEIAFRTGFSDTSTFSAAVRNWTGRAPSQYREQVLGL